jgi:TorA maturation chaperone TorD
MAAMTQNREELAERFAALGRFLLRPAPGVEQEHTRLFLSPSGAPCPPWQSVYEPCEGETPTLLGPAHHSALDWYRRYGVEPQSETEPADHAGLLLLFYAELLASGEPKETLALFRAQHLSWLPAFFTQVASETAEQPFRELLPELAALLGSGD